MFLDFYNLREQPFGVTPNPAFLYLSHSHREALASLFYAVENERGFAALIAPPGMGKTTLLFHMLEKLRPRNHTAFLFQTQCDSSQLLRYLLVDLGCPTEERDLVKLHFELNKILVREARAGRRLVVVIDEAQDLDESVLETLRLLSDFETPSRKLMQIVLAGQPQLAEKLARPELSQLLQRFYIVSRLAPFNSEETHDYVEHRLKVAGYQGKPLFQPEAFGLIASHSQGIPRVINNLCFHAMTLGFAKKKRTIDTATVREALTDLNLQQASATVELSASSVSETAHDRGLPVDTTAATKFPSHGGVAATRSGWVDDGNALGRLKPNQDGVVKPNERALPVHSPAASSWMQWVSVIRSPRDEQLPSPGGVAATPPGWVQEKIRRVGGPGLQEMSEDVGGCVPSRGVVNPNQDGVAELRHPIASSLIGDSAVKLPSPGGVAAAQPGWVNDRNALKGLNSEDPNQVDVASLRHPTKQGDSTIKTFTFRPLAIAGSPLLILLVWFAYSGNLPELFHNGLARTQPGWAEQAPLLAQEGAGGGPGRSADCLVVVVTPNQTLRQICLHYLGRYTLSLANEIVRLNPSLKDPNFIMAGQRLRLPVKGEKRHESPPRNVEPATAVAQKH